jgi:hypothetical protein
MSVRPCDLISTYYVETLHNIQSNINQFLLTSIREATCFGVFKPSSSGLLLDEYCTRMLH